MKRNALLIGSFVIIAFGIIVAAVLWLNGNSLFSKQLPATIYFAGNVGGLYVGAPVTFRGVGVGQVDNIAIEVDSDTLLARIRASVRLNFSAVAFSKKNEPNAPHDLPTLVQRGLRARLVAQSFVTGQKSIELDFVPNTPSTLVGKSDETEIPAVGDRFGALIDQVADLPLRDTVNDIRDTVKELRTALIIAQQSLEVAQHVIKDAGQELGKTGADARETVHAATEAIRQLQAHSAVTLASITQLSETSRQTVVTIQPELQRTIVAARDASESARLAINRVAEMTAPGASLRGDLDGAVRDLSQAASSLRDWSELLEQKPNAIIFGNKSE